MPTCYAAQGLFVTPSPWHLLKVQKEGKVKVMGAGAIPHVPEQATGRAKGQGCYRGGTKTLEMEGTARRKAGVSMQPREEKARAGSWQEPQAGPQSRFRQDLADGCGDPDWSPLKASGEESCCMVSSWGPGGWPSSLWAGLQHVSPHCPPPLIHLILSPPQNWFI